MAIRAILTALALLALTAFPALASGDTGSGDTVMKTFELTIKGEVPEGDSFYVGYDVEGAEPGSREFILFCGELVEEEPQEPCEGGGTVYTGSDTFPAGTTIDFFFGRNNADVSVVDVFHEGTETLDADMTNTAWFRYDETDDGDDGGTGAGDDDKAETVAKTFELTLNGDVPADDGFIVSYLDEGDDPEEAGRFIVLCGDLSRLPPEDRADIPDEDIVSDEACIGGGNTYTFEDEFPRGTRLAVFFARASVTDENVFDIFFTTVDDPGRIESGEDPIPSDFETLDTDMTNSAWFTYSGAGDDDQDDDMPDEMPNTGVGALAGTGFPLAATVALPAVAAALLAARRR